VQLEGDFSAFYARRLAVLMGLEGSLLHKIADIVEKMYKLFITKDLDLVEINPLGVSSQGEVMALDGKVTVNDLASSRHPELGQPLSPNKTTKVESTGNIGLISNSWGIALATIDALAWQGGKTHTCTIVENTFLASAWEEALATIGNLEGIKAILLNVDDNQLVQETILSVLLKLPSYQDTISEDDRIPRQTARNSTMRHSRPTNSLNIATPPLIIYLLGYDQAGPQLGRLWNVYSTTTMEEAIAKVIEQTEK